MQVVCNMKLKTVARARQGHVKKQKLMFKDL